MNAPEDLFRKGMVRCRLAGKEAMFPEPEMELKNFPLFSQFRGTRVHAKILQNPTRGNAKEMSTRTRHGAP